MINIIWAIMAIIGIVYAMFNGTMSDVNEAILSSASEAVTLTIGLISVLVFWLGMMEIAKKAGILDILSNLFKPIAKRIFPEIPEKDPAMGYILSNITANIFGLGNAATPLGLKAMEEMKRLSKSNVASRSMITFLALNTSSLTLFPTVVISIRMQYDSLSPTEIIMPTIIATTLSTIFALMFDRYFYFKSTRKN